MNKEEKLKIEVEKERIKKENNKRKEELIQKIKLAKKTKKKNMTPEQLAFYKQGSKKGRRKSFLIRSAIKCSLLAGIAFGGYKGYQYLTKTYSPSVIEKTKDILDITGGYLYNYIYYKSAYALESGKTEAMSLVIDQMIDKFEELKQQLEDAQGQISGNIPDGHNTNGLYNFPKRSLSADEKTSTANFIVGLYNNGETSKFDIQTFQWADTFNLSVVTTHENGDHELNLSFAGNEGTMKEGRIVFGENPVPFSRDLYNKFGFNGLKPALSLIQNIFGGFDTAIKGIGIDGNTVTMEQMTNFLKEEDCLEYLKNAGFDLGVDTDKIEDILNGTEENEEVLNP